MLKAGLCLENKTGNAPAIIACDHAHNLVPCFVRAVDSANAATQRHVFSDPHINTNGLSAIYPDTGGARSFNLDFAHDRYVPVTAGIKRYGTVFRVTYNFLRPVKTTRVTCWLSD